MSMLLAMPAMAIEKNAQAKKILDATAKRINSAKGIEASFKMSNYVGSSEQGSGYGTIMLMGKKFKINAGGQMSWFDGKTLWNYSPDIDEVNISIPTKKELQAMNPYNFVSLYKQGYGYTVKTTQYSGKEVYEVRLLAERANNEIPEILITISKDYTPLCIRMRQGAKNWTRININKFQSNKSFSDNSFTFPKAAYPNAEVIDMR